MAKKTVSDQMELFEDGGFRDQGNTKDPVSKNPVPVGSTQEEVRDDIPAQLSEGEFVLPADVFGGHSGVRHDQRRHVEFGLPVLGTHSACRSHGCARLPTGNPQ